MESMKVLKKKEILILGFSSIVSGLGNWITMMAILSLLIFKGDGGVLESSGIFMAGLLPIMLGAPLAGKLADQYNRKHLMMISELGAGVTIGIIIFTENIWLIYLAMALQALFISLMNPARQSALPQLVENAGELEKVNAFFQQLNSVLKIAAPVFAGFLLTIMNAHQAIILDMITFLLSVVILSRLPDLLPAGDKGARESGEKDGEAPALRKENEPLQVLLHSVPLRLLFLSSFFTVLIIVSFDILGSVYIRDVLHGDESFLGLIIGILGFGSFLVSLLVVLRKGKPRYWQDLALGNFLLAVLPLCMTLGFFIQDPLWVKVLILSGGFLGGLGNGFLVIQISTILQVTAPMHMLGRLSGYLEFTMIGGQLFSVILLPILVPGIIQPYVYFLGATAALWILSAALQVESKKFTAGTAVLQPAVSIHAGGEG
jgi:MFS family permease